MGRHGRRTPDRVPLREQEQDQDEKPIVIIYKDKFLSTNFMKVKVFVKAKAGAKIEK
ncbi:MAG: hypothetical protein UT00_C0001G0068 [Parcubacteria group bacterium GW2011_GWA1_38_7]|nr:MAG: hypothetical protein UT00_C0001G0068 [Parcubacteria group bacterium GW2011_GWA1_38_7]